MRMRYKRKFVIPVLILGLGLLVGCTSQKELEVSVQGAGKVTPPAGKHTYRKNEKVTLEAESTVAKWGFKKWKGSIDRTENPTEIVMDGDLGVTAVFERQAFKLVNSWGENWGPNGDGTLYMTYEAAIKNELICFVMEPRDDYEPQAIALFEVDDSERSNWTFRVNVVGEEDDKYFYPWDAENNESLMYQKGGEEPFPDNKLVLDITELLPLDGDTIELEVTNNSDTLDTLESFEIYTYDDYSSSPTDTYGGTDLSGTVAAGGTETFSIDNVSASSASAGFKAGAGTFNLRDVSRALTESDIEEMSREKESNYNQLVDGHGTGWKPMTEAKWREALESGLIRKLETEEILASADGEELVDHSQSKHFPPIGDQGGEGACVAWSTAYYAQTFYEARDRGWDLSATVSDDKLMSPEFLYHLINGGIDNGSHYFDALRVLENIGVASLAKMPYSDTDHTSWPTETAFKEAPQYRTKTTSEGTVGYAFRIKGKEEIEAVEELLRQGYLITVAIDSGQYDYLTENGVWTEDNYRAETLDHANTIVGFYN